MQFWFYFFWHRIIEFKTSLNENMLLPFFTLLNYTAPCTQRSATRIIMGAWSRWAANRIYYNHSFYQETCLIHFWLFSHKVIKFSAFSMRIIFTFYWLFVLSYTRRAQFCLYLVSVWQEKKINRSLTIKFYARLVSPHPKYR